MGRGEGTTYLCPGETRWPQPEDRNTRVLQKQSKLGWFLQGQPRDGPGQPQAGSGGSLRGHCLASGSCSGEDEVYLVLQE